MTLIKSNLGVKDLIQVRGGSASLKEVRAETQAVFEAEIMEEHCLLAHSGRPMLSSLS